MTQLEALSLSYNEISDVSFLKGLTQLEALSLSYNEISDISFLQSLLQLQTLYLSRNRISDISSLQDLPQLQTLDLADNQISDIAQVKEILELPALEFLNLHNNPLPYLPKEVLEEGEYEGCLFILRDYFSHQEFVPNKRVKLLLLGNGMVGKTTFLKRLLNPEGDWETEIYVRPQDRTIGIDVQREQYALSEDILLYIWDFGGQEIYHGTHRLFMSQDALYLIFWAFDTEEKAEERRHELVYWLDYLQNRSLRSPVLLVHTQIDKPEEQDRSQQHEYLRAAYAHPYSRYISHFDMRISAKTSEGFEELKQALQNAIRQKLATLLQAEIPLTWAKVREELEAKQQAGIKTLSLSDYKVLCEKEEYALKGTQPDTLLLFLHRTGFLYYDIKLSKDIILNQLWALEGIYKVLAPHSAVELAKGNISKEALAEAFLKEKYSSSEIETFLDYILSAEIAFCLEGSEYKKFKNPTFIFPQFLPFSHEVVDDWEGEGCLHFAYAPPFVHSDLVNRFLVRLGRLSEKTAIWCRGIRIFYPDEPKTKALITFEPTEKRVYIQTKGSAKDVFLQKIIQELDAIIDDNNETKPSKKMRYFLSIDGKQFVEILSFVEAVENEAKYVRDIDNKKVLLSELIQIWGSTRKVSQEHSEKEKEEPTLSQQAAKIVLPEEEVDKNISSQVQTKSSLKTVSSEKNYENSHSNPKQNTSMAQIPDFFIADLEKQVKEQYKKIIRNRDLRNDEIDEELREKYAKEIALRQKNIKEIQTEFLNQVKIENPNITEAEATKISNAVVEAVRKELETFRLDLQTFVKSDLQTALSQLNFNFPSETLKNLEAEIKFLQEENKDGVLALADLILDLADNQENTDKEIAKILPLIKEIKNSDILDAKIKLAVPLFEYLGVAKIEAEVELKPIPLWEKFKNRFSTKKQ